nr:hypothetical protein Iba_chr02dCG1210 [Ipomoea batatas]
MPPELSLSPPSARTVAVGRRKLATLLLLSEVQNKTDLQHRHRSSSPLSYVDLKPSVALVVVDLRSSLVAAAHHATSHRCRCSRHQYSAAIVDLREGSHQPSPVPEAKCEIRLGEPRSE